MSLASISIRNPVFAWMLMLGFIVFGIIGFQRLPVGQYPDIDFPDITINAVLEGASPEIMESDVVYYIEDAVQAVEGIREINSTCRLGSASVTVSFELHRNIELALQDVQARVAQAQRRLPPDMEPVTITKANPEENPIMWIALSGTRSMKDIGEYAKNVLRDRFLTVDGNGDVMMGGFLERNVRIWIDPSALTAQGLTADDVIQAIQREHIEVPAGRLEGPNREANVRIEGEALKVEEMRTITVAVRQGSPVYLKDVALIEDGFEDKRRTARANGLPTQSLGIIKQHGANTVEVAEKVHEKIAELRKTLPEGMHLDVRVDNSKFIKDAVHEIEFTLLLSALLTAFVCWLFLGSFSATFNVLLAIPVSVFGTFAVMYFAGFSMNTFTLLALSLSIGIVVDDAVMVLENIYRHAEMGKDKVAAARDGAEQITFAALAATIAIIAIFLPVAFMTGIMGKFFFQFGVVLSVAVAISLLEALTLAPSRCAQFLRVGHRSNIVERGAGIAFNFLARLYRWIIRHLLSFRTQITGKVLGSAVALVVIAATAFCVWKVSLVRGLNSDTALWGILALLALATAAGTSSLVMTRKKYPTGPVLVLLGSLAIFVVSLPLAKDLPKEMVPKQDQGYYMIRSIGPVGSSLEYTDNVLRHLEKILAKQDEIESTLSVVGGMQGDVNVGISFLTLKPLHERTVTQQQSMDNFRKALDADPIPGVNVVPVEFSQQGLGSSRRGGLSIEYSIRGPDWETLGKLSETFMEDMRASGVFSEVDTDYRKGMPEIQVLPDREKALAHNLDFKTLSETIGVLVGGGKVARFKDNGRRYDVRMRIMREGRERPEDIGNTYVRARDGKLVRLGDVAQISMRPSLQSITRQQRERAVTLMANPATGHSQDEAMRYVENLGRQKLPEFYTINQGGSTRVFSESQYSLLFALAMGVIVAYMVLASQFNSFLHPLTVLLALPFSVTGALLALVYTNNSLNMYSMIGLILLMGIVKKNSILLVDYTNQLREQGMERDAALIDACPTRLRPILMTTFATIAGALPSALAWGPGGELLIPMATAIIGGLTLSTLLTLVVVPCFYSVMDEAKMNLSNAWNAIFKGHEEPVQVLHSATRVEATADASAAGK